MDDSLVHCHRDCEVEHRQRTLFFLLIFLSILYFYQFISSQEPKAQGELIGWDSSRRPSIRPSVRLFTLSDMNISETSWPIMNKFHLKRHWGGRLAALGFRPDWIITLVSMATDSSHRVIMGKIL